MSKTQPNHANVRATKAPMACRSCVACPSTVHQPRPKFLRHGVRARPAGSLMVGLLFLDYGIRRWRELKLPGNEEQTAHLQTGLLHGLCDPRCEPLGGTPFAERDNAEAFPCLLSSFSTNGLTCLLHLHFTSCRNTPIHYAIAAGETGIALTCRGSNRQPLVMMAHRMRAFLFAIATAAFC